jgi:UDP-N-acetylmuramoylalanine--D-glutamate ligase
MYELQNKQVLVIGLGARGREACELLLGSGARVAAVDRADTEELRAEAGRLRSLGVQVELRAALAPRRHFDLAVVSPAVPGDAPIIREMKQRGIPVMGELELGCQRSQCLSVAVAGTNGKGTTTSLTEQLLTRNQRKVVVCGHGARPVCSVAACTTELDYLVLQVNSFQLEATRAFRPAVAVLLNLAPDHRDRFPSHDDYVRANARLFRNQQAFDWAIVQSEALAQMRALNLEIPAKVITFSARDRNADVHFERGLLLSRIAGWSGPLLDTDNCQLRGLHNAENLMAALLVGHALHVPLDVMTPVLHAAEAGPHCCERVAEINGVLFVNDSKGANLDALQQALTSLPGVGARPNVWLIAGGKDKGLEYHDAGPLLSQRVKGAFLIGETREKMRAAWGLFTPCTMMGSLLEAVTVAARNAASGDVILLSPACSSFDQFRNYQHRGEVFRQAVADLAASATDNGEFAPELHSAAA